MDKTNWDEYLQFFTYAYNTTPSTTHGYTPFELVYGKTPTNFDFLQTNDIDPLYNIEDYSKELKFRLQVAHKRAKELLEKTKEKCKSWYDSKVNTQEINVNDMVYLRNESGHKLDSIYKGPYQVIGLDNINNCTIKINEKNHVVHKNRLRKA